MATQWPQLVSRLVTLLPTLSGWSAVTVFDGPPVTGDTPEDYCTVGFVNPDSGQVFPAGNYTDDLSQVGNAFSAESGEIHCQLVCGGGDVDLAAVRTRAFGYTDTLRASLRTDPTVGVLPAGSVANLLVEVVSMQNNQGAAQSLVLTVAYQCPIVS